MAPKRDRAPKTPKGPKAPRAPRAKKQTEPKPKRQSAPPALRFRDNVGKMAMGMQNEGDIALSYITNLTSTLEPCTVAQYTMVELVDMFVDGKLNLDPNGQRNLIVSREYIVSFAKTIMQTSLGIPSIMLNKRPDTSCDVVDGKQRVASMIALACGMVPSIEDAYLVSLSSKPEWHFTTLLGSEHASVVQIIETIRSQVGAPADTDEISIVDERARTKFCSGHLLAQLYDNWPAPALAAASALYCTKTISHTPNEIVFQLDNPLCNLVRKYDADATRVLGTLSKSNPVNMHKAVFGDMLRGIACGIPGVEFVPKANNAFGYGQFMDSLVPLAMGELNADSVKKVTRACSTRFGKFVEYCREHTIQFRSFKPDMIAMLFYMLYVNYEPDGICEMLWCLSAPKREGNNETDLEWVLTEYRKNKNMREAFQAYSADALENA
jgi:hypothetical protein